jgi:prepilin-type N-terminal cleavage/methylation domain-containing protein
MHSTKLFSSIFKKHDGFSVIEMIVAIGIIGALFGIIFAKTKSTKNNAIATKTLEQLQVIEVGLRDHFGNQEYFTSESELGLGSNPSVSTLMVAGVLSDFFNAAPTLTFGTVHEFLYDNDRVPGGDDDFYTDMPGTCTLNGDDEKGVNILLPGIFDYDPQIAIDIDKLHDNGDGFGCGKIKRNGPAGEYLVYHLSNTYEKVE